MSSSKTAERVSITKDEATGEWWVYVTPDLSEIEFQNALSEVNVKDAVLVEYGIASKGRNYMVFQEPGALV